MSSRANTRSESLSLQGHNITVRIEAKKEKTEALRRKWLKAMKCNEADLLADLDGEFILRGSERIYLPQELELSYPY
jgi:hypothetical protein